ncbi:acyltransferase [Gordonia shandongensis]|uniref:acyltransferase n=1 Tax=Gordonia shandongensis TaxID=376351 RepID=UPI0004138A1A|nr:acyltransferase [Gordonia shandongensis]
MAQTVEETGRTRRGDGRATGVVTGPATQQRQRPGRALTADFVRVLLFTGVVVAHSVNGLNVEPDVVRSAGLVGTLLHVTRYGFVAVTLFVLVLSMRGRTMTPTQFWRRRFGLIVGPYLVWTLVYTITDHLVIQNNPFPSIDVLLRDLALSTVTGNGKYQLYFLLISMQIYLVFPLLSAIFERTAHRPWTVIAVGFAIQGTMFVVYQYLPRPEGAAWEQVYHNMWKTLPMYALFIAIGAMAAYHHSAMEDWLRRRAVPVTVVAVLACAVTIAAYWSATGPGDVPPSTTTPWNPTIMPWLIGSLVLLWLGAMTWDRLRASGAPVGERFVSWATVRAFGVFAVHPLLLDAVARAGFFGTLHSWFPGSPALRSIVLVLVVLVSSLLVVDVLLRTPVSRWFVARDRIPIGGAR